MRKHAVPKQYETRQLDWLRKKGIKYRSQENSKIFVDRQTSVIDSIYNITTDHLSNFDVQISKITSKNIDAF